MYDDSRARARHAAPCARPALTLIATLALTLPLGVPLAQAYTELEFGPTPVTLSSSATVAADKARILRLNDGTLIAAWQEAIGPADGAWTWEGELYTPRDIFMRTSTDGGATWTDAVNLSNTANQTDPTALYDRLGDDTLVPYYGDSDKPGIFAVGNNIVISWNDTYCGPGVHGPALYPSDLGVIEVPFRCEYAARLTASAGTITLVNVDRLSDASRDANEEVVRGTSAGFAMIWQEDPLGLQPGEALGEGDGASGARTSEGTDVWWATLPTAAFADPAATWSQPIPISNNYDYQNDVVTGGGSSRAQLALVGNPAWAVIVYEERKNTGQGDTGKYVMYHEFPFASPPVSQPGTILSDPAENGRRARIVTQGTPGTTTGARAVIMWRQGIGRQGAPSDFMMRVGRVPAGTSIGTVPNAGFRVEDLWPAVDPLDPTASVAALNLSSASLTDSTSEFPDQDAKAHRAVLDGDFIFAGYTQTESVLEPEQKYRYLLRRSVDGGANWTAPQDVSSVASAGVDVIEPRLVRTPATVSSGKPEDVRDPNTYLVGWGTSPTQPTAGDPLPGDLYASRTTDRGDSFEDVQRLRTPDDPLTFTDEGLQAVTTPDGKQVYAVWIRRDGDEAIALFNSAIAVERTADLAVTGATTTPSVDLGATVSAEFTLTNAGPDTATELTLTLTPDAAFDLQSVVAENGTCSGSAPVLCEFDDLPSGASVTTTITLSSQTAGSHAVTAIAAAREVEPTPQNNAATVAFDYVPKADLGVALTASVTSTKEGKTFTLGLEFANAGPQPATNALARVTLPANLRATAATGCQIQGADVLCARPQLAVDEHWSTSIEVRAESKGSAVVNATVSADELDPALANNTDSVEIRVRNSGGGGCSLQPGAPIDPTLPLLLVGAIAWLARRRAGTGRAA